MSFFFLVWVGFLFCFDLAFILPWTHGDGCITTGGVTARGALARHNFCNIYMSIVLWEVFTDEEDRKSVILQVT